MNRSAIDTYVTRKLYAESMGKCMNPNCKVDLFYGDGDISEKAHIVAYCETKDNSYENLVILCPNCHTNFDKNNVFSKEEVREWKKIRKNELDAFFCEKFRSFEELRKKIVPLLSENQKIYKEYYLGDQRGLWDSFEPIILVNNHKVKILLKNNMNLIQNYKKEYESNRDYVEQLLLHIDEFEKTRGNSEKIRKTLFPVEINSMFGIEPIHDGLTPMTESLENLISKIDCKDVVLGIVNPYIIVHIDDQDEQIFLDDTPRIMQMFYDHNCFRKIGVRLQNLNFALQFLKDRGGNFSFCYKGNLREIECWGYHIIYVYCYCLSKNDLERMMPKVNSIIVNLHHWNDESCISQEAYEMAKAMGVTLLTSRAYYAFVNKNRKN